MTRVEMQLGKRMRNVNTNGRGEGRDDSEVEEQNKRLSHEGKELRIKSTKRGKIMKEKRWREEE